MDCLVLKSSIHKTIHQTVIRRSIVLHLFLGPSSDEIAAGPTS